MTKYILAGGFISKASDNGRKFCEELVRGYAEPVRVLICTFSSDNDWGGVYERDATFIQNHLPHQKLEFKLATVAGFAQEAAWADAIYFKGGSIETLMDGLAVSLGRNPRDWTAAFEGKTVAGTSAGAQVLVHHYYHADRGRIDQGMGLLPINLIVHYRSNYKGEGFDWDAAYRSLEAEGEQLPIVALKEGEFRVATV